MSELNINDLPGEILENVFRHLDGRSMKNATLTCKLWNNLVEFACRWSLKLLYIWDDELVRPYIKQKMNFILTTNRRFATITIREGRLGENNQILEIFRRHGFNVVNLCLIKCHMDSLVALAELLNLTPNLKHAVMNTIMYEDSSDVRLDQVLPDLKKLKNLEMYRCYKRIIKCFQKAQLTTITIEEREHTRDYGLLIDFLSSQEKLTSLNAGFDILNELGKLKVPILFRLTQLEIPHNFHTQPLDNLLRFFKSQAESLKEMEIRSHISRYFCRCIMAQNLSKLESLSIASCLIGCVKLPDLKKLRIRYLFDKVDWNEFTKIHSRLVELTIEKIADKSFLTSDDIDQITTNADIQSIRLGVGFEADDRFFEIIRTKCANLKVLDLHRLCISRGVRQNVEINMLRLCDEIE